MKRQTMRVLSIVALGLGLAIGVSAVGGPAAADVAVDGSNDRLRALRQRFPEADANADGTLTRAEWEAHEAATQREQRAQRARMLRGSAHVAPTLTNVAYGVSRSQVLDFWRAPATNPVPVLIHFHGGGFVSGGKALSLLQAEALEHGISAVSANYRLVSEAPYPAPMHDAARVVQFVRSRAAEWGIDTTRIAVSGDSAGGCLALWVALHDSLGDPASADPVGRQSSRVRCALGSGAQTSCDPDFLSRSLADGNPLRVYPHLLRFYGVATLADLATPDAQARIRDASPSEHVDASDPPVHLGYASAPPALGRFSSQAEPNAVLHNGMFGALLKERADAAGLTCHVYWPGREAPRTNTPLRFLLREFGVPQESVRLKPSALFQTQKEECRS